MSQVVNQRRGRRSILSTLYAPIEEELVQVESLLRKTLRSDYDYVDELVRHGCLLGGKRLRPALLLLSARAAGTLGDAHITLATVVEMIHTATLVHDDVLDGAVMRRHLATVNARWDNHASVLLGDYLFTHSFHLASTLETTHACRLIGHSTNVVCEGEMRQKGSCGDYEISEDEYISILDAKTAELCACSCQLGAHYAGADADVTERFGRFGRNLGIAFQIADDLLDVVGQESATGKSLGTDLEQEKPTLPLIRLLHKAEPDDREQVVSILKSDPASRPQMLEPLLAKYGAVDYTRQRAEQFIDCARRELEGLPPSPALESLERMTQFVVRRSH